MYRCKYIVLDCVLKNGCACPEKRVAARHQGKLLIYLVLWLYKSAVACSPPSDTAMAHTDTCVERKEPQTRERRV